MASPRRFQHRNQSQRRKTAWDFGPNLTVVASTAVQKRVWTNGIALAAESQSTITRIRGQISLYLDLVTAAGDGFSGAIGLGIVTADAFAIGETAMPGPFSDPEWNGWIWHEFFTLRGVAAQSSGENIARNATADRQITIDSKAQRIFRSNEVLFGMTELAVETGTAGMTMQGDTRVLFKLT